MRRSAESRRCPKCKRGSALRHIPTDWDLGLASLTYCRWEDCDYERHGSEAESV